MPHPPSHLEKEGEAKVWGPQLMKVLQQKIWQKKPHPSSLLKRMGGANMYKK